MCRPELIVNNDIARTAPITHEGSHSMRASLARIPLRNNGLTAFWRKFYESRPTLSIDSSLPLESDIVSCIVCPYCSCDSLVAAKGCDANARSRRHRETPASRGRDEPCINTARATRVGSRRLSHLRNPSDSAISLATLTLGRPLTFPNVRPTETGLFPECVHPCVAFCHCRAEPPCGLLTLSPCKDVHMATDRHTTVVRHSWRPAGGAVCPRLFGTRPRPASNPRIAG
ncbi:hypothetical protein BX589_1379 [Paraburkholderia fungorum]|nr:hypothetical protein BX589_1379 [Paraburkholderia fungorum]